MKTITLDEYKMLVRRNDWHHEQTVEILGSDYVDNEEWDKDTEDYKSIQKTMIYGTGFIESNLGDVIITYQEWFEYYRYDEYSFSASPEGLDDAWTLKGVRVVDEDGDPVTDLEWDDLPVRFSEIDYSSIKNGINETIDIDNDTEIEGSDMEKYILKVDNVPNIGFTGELIASAASTEDKTLGRNYSGETGRWADLKLFKTTGGKYVCYKVDHTIWDCERDRRSAAICENHQEIIAFFGHRWLAKELYENAEIADTLEVE